MNARIILFFLVLLFVLPAFAAKTIYSDRTTMTCWDYDRAIQYAPKPSYSQVRAELGCSRVEIIERGADNCRQACRGDGYVCQGYVIARCR